MIEVDEYAFAALRAGASGFLLEDPPPADLLSAIRAVASGDALVAPSTTRRLLERFAPRLPDPAEPEPANELEALTPREREVVAAVARGLSNSEIADELVLSEATVKTRVGRILAKLELRDRVPIVRLRLRARARGAGGVRIARRAPDDGLSARPEFRGLATIMAP